jgi:hypothetical protein
MDFTTTDIVLVSTGVIVELGMIVMNAVGAVFTMGFGADVVFVKDRKSNSTVKDVGLDNLKKK